MNHPFRIACCLLFLSLGLDCPAEPANKRPFDADAWLALCQSKMQELGRFEMVFETTTTTDPSHALAERTGMISQMRENTRLHLENPRQIEQVPPTIEG